MNTALRFAAGLLEGIHADLDREHGFAAERVGFIACKTASLADGLLLLAAEYLAIADDDYEDDVDPEVGAMMGPGAIRSAMEHAYNHDVSMLHVHRHEHFGQPRFSPLDVRESAKFVPDFWKVRPRRPHGALVLSRDSMFGLTWDPVSKRPSPINQVAVVGLPLRTFGGLWK